MVGYATDAGTTTGLEQSLDDYLTGANTNLTNTFKQELDRLGGQTVHGDNVYAHALRPDIQRLALDQLGGRCGAVVVLDPQTGAVVAMASSPTYNANLVVSRRLREDREDQGDRAATLRRCRTTRPQGLYPPGSTFKMVTAVGRARLAAPTRRARGFNDPGYCTEYGKRGLERGQPGLAERPEVFGNIDARRRASSTRSTPSSATSACTSEAAKILDYAKRFGFYSLAAARDAARTRAPRPASTSTTSTGGYLWTPTSQQRRSIRAGSRSGRQHARHAAPDGARRRDDRQPRPS